MADYYGSDSTDLTAKRRQQALQSALVGDMNETTPQAPTMGTMDAHETDPQPADPAGPPDLSTPPGAGPDPYAGPRYNTTPGWQDPLSAPSYNNGNPDQYWAQWILANPDYRGQGYNGPSVAPPPVVQPPTNPSGGIPPGNGLPPGMDAFKTWVQSFMQGAPHYDFATPEAQGAESAQYALLQRILDAPDQYSEQNIRQMQEAQKEQALATQQGAVTKLQDRYAAMGRSGSGRLDANTRRLQDSTTQQVLQGNRDVDLQAKGANFGSRLSALQQASGVLNDASARRTSQADTNLKSQALALQAALGAGGLGLDWQQLLAQLAMFNTNQTNSFLR